MTLSIYAETSLPTVHGQMRLRSYRDPEVENGQFNEPLVLISGFLDRSLPVNLRIHSACITSEVFGSCKCDCKQQLDFALAYIARHTGLVIYLHQEGRGIGVGNKVRVYALQEQGYDTLEANEMLGFPGDARDYYQAVSILREQRIERVNLMTNNPDKVAFLERAGIIIDRRIPVKIPGNGDSDQYLAAKRNKMGHFL